MKGYHLYRRTFHETKIMLTYFEEPVITHLAKSIRSHIEHFRTTVDVTYTIRAVGKPN